MLSCASQPLSVWQHVYSSWKAVADLGFHRRTILQCRSLDSMGKRTTRPRLVPIIQRPIRQGNHQANTRHHDKMVMHPLHRPCRSRSQTNAINTKGTSAGWRTRGRNSLGFAFAAEYSRSWRVTTPGAESPLVVRAGLAGAEGGGCSATAALSLGSGLPLSMPVMRSRRRRGCRTIKRVERAWLGDTAAVMHYRRVVKSRGSQ